MLNLHIENERDRTLAASRPIFTIFLLLQFELHTTRNQLSTEAHRSPQHEDGAPRAFGASALFGSISASPLDRCSGDLPIFDVTTPFAHVRERYRPHRVTKKKDLRGMRHNHDIGMGRKAGSRTSATSASQR